MLCIICCLLLNQGHGCTKLVLFFFLQLRAYAKVAQRNNTQAQELANPDYKGYTLPHDAVMHYTNELWNTTRGKVGEGVFTILYSLNILVTLVLLMYLLLSLTAYEVYDRLVKESRLNKIQFAVAAHLAFAYILAFVIAEIVQRAKLPTSALQNWILTLKFIGASLIIAVVFLISICKCIIYYKSATVSKNCTKILVVAVLALLISILTLDITPTILLFFVFPTDTFSLLAIHAALFYTEVMVGTLFWLKCGQSKCKSCVRSNNEETNHYGTFTINSTEREELPADRIPWPLSCRCCGSTLMKHLIVSVIVIFLCALVYFPAIFFFLFLILRNANSGAFDILIKYIPSIAIGFFGIYIRKELLDKEDKDAKLWLKLGELLQLTTEEVKKKTINAKHLKSLKAAYHGTHTRTQQVHVLSRRRYHS